MNPHPTPDPLRLIGAHHAANEFYRSRTQAEPRALTYLRSRGIVPATAHSPPWTLGYAPRGWNQLCDHLRQTGYTDHELLAAGLATTTGTGHLNDVFRDRVMFPIRDPNGHVVAFTGRDLSGRSTTPKYRNTTTTAIYSKKHTLYGLAEQLGGDTPPAAVMLVEGPADVVAIARLRQTLATDEYQQPYAAVAPCGTALTTEQVAALTDAVPPGTPLVVAFDPDTAGRAALNKAYKLLRDWPGQVDAIALPAGTDPASLVAQERANAVTVLEQARRPLADLLIDQRLTRYRLDEIPGRFAALHATAPLIADQATHDIDHAARLAAHLSTRLDLNPLTVYEAAFPPASDATTDHGPPPPPAEPSAAPPPASTDVRADPRTAIPLGGPGFPDPELVGHQYARLCPPAVPAITWVQHDATTGRTAWVLAEGVADTPGDRYAAHLAAEVAGRVAVLVGARQAVDIARTAVNTHFAQPGAGRGDAAIAVLTCDTNDPPVSGQPRFTLAWAGDITAYGTTGRWFAPLTTDPTRHAAEPGSPRDVLTASVRGGPIGVNHIQTPLAQILLAGRAVRHVAPESIRPAIEWRKPTNAIAQLALLSPFTAALVVRPRAGPATRGFTAVEVARQDQPARTPRSPAPLPQRAVRRALPAAPPQHHATR